jgi:hypothetical protein
VIRRDGQKRAGKITAPTAVFESIEKSTKKSPPKSYRPKTLITKGFFIAFYEFYPSTVQYIYFHVQDVYCDLSANPRPESVKWTICEGENLEK